MKYAREGTFLQKSPLPRAPSSKDEGGRRWGRGRFSERSASPPDPYSRRAAGVWRGAILQRWFRLRGGRAPLESCESTAADKAAADMRRGGVSSAMRVTAHDSSLCRGRRLEACKKNGHDGLHRHGIFDDMLIALSRSSMLAGRGGSVSRHAHNQTTGNRIHTAWRELPKEQTSLFPATFRERASCMMLRC